MNEYAPVHPISGKRSGGVAMQAGGAQFRALAAVGFGAAPSVWVGCWRGLFAVSRHRATVIVSSYYLASEPCHGHSYDAYDHRQDGGA